jgi:hypothetical protein
MVGGTSVILKSAGVFFAKLQGLARVDRYGIV